jgi:hypothetical protein
MLNEAFDEAPIALKEGSDSKGIINPVDVLVSGAESIHFRIA